MLPLKAVGWGPFGLLASQPKVWLSVTAGKSMESSARKQGAKQRGLEVHGGYADDLLQRTILKQPHHTLKKKTEVAGSQVT